MRPLLATLMLLAAGTAVAQDPPPAQVAGHVTEPSSGAGIEGARVRMNPLGDLPRDDNARPVEVITDAAGAYRAALPYALYLVTVSKPGFTEVPQPLDARFHRFQPGERVEDLILSMNRGGTLSGRVVDIDGKPLAQFAVNALPLAWREGRRATDRGPRTITAADGTFTFAALAANDYVLVAMPIRPENTARRNADGRLSYGATFHPATLDLEKAEQVTLEPGGTVANIAIAVQPASTVALTGRVMDTGGAAASRAMLTLRSNGLNLAPGLRATQQAFTAVDGTFRFDAPPGDYTLDVVIPSRTPPPGGTDVLMTNPDGASIYILQNSPRTSTDVVIGTTPNDVTVTMPRR